MITKIFKRLPAWIFLGFCLFITGAALVVMANQESRLRLPAPLLILPGTILFGGLIYFLSKRISKIKKDRVWLFLSLGIVVLLQLLVIFFVARIHPITDTYTTLDEALAMRGQGGLLDNNSAYFARYPNNYFFTILMHYLLWGADALGISYLTYAALINLCAIDLALVLGYFLVDNMWGKKGANQYLLLAILCPTNYLFLYFSYTNTFSMPFIMGILLCGIKRGYGNKLAFVALSLLGFFLRPTCIFASIGVLFYWFLKGKKWTKKDFLKLLPLLALAAVLILGQRILLNRHLANPSNDQGFPATHWIMVGLNKTGEVRGKDVRFTQAHREKDAKVRADLDQIKKRATDLGPLGIGRLYLTKVGKIWAVGTDDFQNWNNSPEDFTPTYHLIYGRDNTWLLAYCQVFRALTFFFMIFFVLKCLREKSLSPLIALIYAMLGIIVFLMIWETNKKHSICYVPVMLVMMEGGLREFRLRLALRVRKFSKKTERKIIGGGSGLCLVLVLAVACLGLKSGPSGHMALYKSEFNMETLSLGEEEICQIVQVKEDFNKVRLHVKKGSGSGDGSLKVKLLNERGQVLAEKIVDQKSLRKKRWISLRCPSCPPGTYSLSLQAQGDCSYLALAYYPGKCLEHFENEHLYVGGKELGKSSLSVRFQKRDPKKHLPATS
ncbi:MAG: hypothetical protein K6G62_01880 [Eubacterium sp.]|nr:hypothetical protein [Eubacterium sp.]